MCGVCAISLAPGTGTNVTRLAFAATIAIESRGPDATGLAWTRLHATPRRWRSPGPATRVVRRAPLPQTASTVIGHARWATKGSPDRNVNNHPVGRDGLYLVHNGVITNDDELVARTGLSRQGIVDSEAAALLLLADLGPVEKVLSEIEGSAALCWLDSRDPDALHLARLDGRPLWVGWTRFGDLVASSTLATLNLTAKLAGITIGSAEEIDPGTYLRVHRGIITDVRSIPGKSPSALYGRTALPLEW